MQAEGEVRSVSLFATATTDGSVTVLPVQFGVGRRDRAVRIESLHYTVTQWGIANTSAFQQWAACLSEDPEHEVTAPVGGITAGIGFSSYYGWVFEATDRLELTEVGYFNEVQKTHHIELHGILRPYRQRVVFYNEVGASAQFRCEILYRPVTLPDQDLRSIDRTHGAIRRS